MGQTQCGRPAPVPSTSNWRPKPGRGIPPVRAPRRRGTSAIEYSLLLSLVSLGCAAAVQRMGTGAADVFDEVSSAAAAGEQSPQEAGGNAEGGEEGEGDAAAGGDQARGTPTGKARAVGKGNAPRRSTGKGPAKASRPSR